MDQHPEQSSSNYQAHSDELQLVVLTQHHRHLMTEISPFDIKQYQNHDEINILLNIAKQLKAHYFTLEQQPFLSLPEKASHISRTAFLSYLIENYGKQLIKGSILFICDPITNKYTSFIYDTLFSPLSDTLFEFLNGIYAEIQPLDREVLFKKASFEFLKRLAPALNTNALQSRRESVHKIARQEVEGFNKLLEIYITSAADADLTEEDILDTLTLLTWFIHRFWKSLVRHIFTATQHIAEAYPHIIPKLPEKLQYLYDKDWFPDNFVNIPEIPSETIQKLLLNRKHIQITNYNAETHLFTCTNIPENKNAALEASPTENMDTIIYNEPPDNGMNETTNTYFNSYLLDDGTLFSSHAVNTIIDLEENNNNNNNNTNYQTKILLQILTCIKITKLDNR